MDYNDAYDVTPRARDATARRADCAEAPCLNKQRGGAGARSIRPPAAHGSEYTVLLSRSYNRGPPGDALCNAGARENSERRAIKRRWVEPRIKRWASSGPLFICCLQRLDQFVCLGPARYKTALKLL